MRRKIAERKKAYIRFVEGLIREVLKQRGRKDIDPRLAAFALLGIINFNPIVAYDDEPLRIVVYRMADSGFTCFPVIDRQDRQKLLGMVSLNDLLKARTRNLAEERQRERVLKLRYLLPVRVEK